MDKWKFCICVFFACQSKDTLAFVSCEGLSDKKFSTYLAKDFSLKELTKEERSKTSEQSRCTVFNKLELDGDYVDPITGAYREQGIRWDGKPRYMA